MLYFKIFISIMLSSIALSTFSYSNSNEAKDLIIRGDELHEKFDNVNSLKYYELAYKTDPSSYEILLKLTRTYNDAGEEMYELRRKEEAERYMNRALENAEMFHKKFPDSADVYTYLAMSYGNIAMFKGGKEKIKLANKVGENGRKAISLNPNNFLPYVIMGIYYRELAKLSWFERAFANTFFGKVPEGTFENSIEMFNKALVLDNNMIVAAYQLSKTYRAMGSEKKEAALLKKVIKMPERNFRDKFAKRKAERRLDKLI